MNYKHVDTQLTRQDKYKKVNSIQNIGRVIPDATYAATNQTELSFTRSAILSSRTINIRLFDGIVQNDLHAIVCASAALTLANLQINSFATAKLWAKFRQ